MNKTKLIGKIVDIIDKDSIYYNFEGKVVYYDGDNYYISGGSISTESDIRLAPIFSRNQFKVRRERKL